MGSDKRKEPRASIEMRVEYRTVGSFLSDWVVNISKGGMFIHTENPLKIGSGVRLIFSLPGIPFLFDLSGEVKWVQEESEEDKNLSGMGIEFVQLDDRVRKRIEAYVKTIGEDIPESIRSAEQDRPRVKMKRLSGSAIDRGEVTQPRHRISKVKPRSSSDEDRE